MTVVDRPPETWHAIRCFAFVESWWRPDNWCPNGQTWTIAALIPSWLLYPWSRKLVAESEALGMRWLVALASVLWLLSFGPSLYMFLSQGGRLTLLQHNYVYVWPPSQMTDFVIGMVAAALVRRHDTSRGAFGSPTANSADFPSTRLRGFIADIACAIILASVVIVPSAGYHVDADALFDHALAPAIAAFLYGSATSGGNGIVAHLLVTGPLPALGRYSFEVFLFQQPLFSAFEVVWIAGLNELIPIGFVGAAFCVTLYILSGLYAEFVDIAFARWLRCSTAAWA